MALPTFPAPTNVYIQPNRFLTQLLEAPVFEPLLTLLNDPHRKFVLAVCLADEETSVDKAVQMSIDTRANVDAALSANADYILADKAVTANDDNTLTNAMVATIHYRAIVNVWRYGLGRVSTERKGPQYAAALDEIEALTAQERLDDIGLGCRLPYNHDNKLWLTANCSYYLASNDVVAKGIDDTLPLLAP